MSSQSASNTSSAQSLGPSSSSRPTSSFSSSRASSSLITSSSRAISSSSSRAISSSSKISPPTIPIASSTSGSPSSSQSSSTQNPSQAAIASATVTPLSHRPGVIAAISACIVAAVLIASLLFFLCRRRRKRQMQIGSSSSEHHFMREQARFEDAKEWRDSQPSTPSSAWPETATPPWTAPTTLAADPRSRQSITSLKTPHYTLRSRASITDSVQGFGQDLAWRDAHYEHPLPSREIEVIPPMPSVLIHPSSSMHPDIDVVPPTPPSGIIHHNMTPATPLKRNPSTASTVNSVYSTASMTLGRSVPDDIVEEQDVPPARQRPSHFF
ncbi:hypothetical protein C8R45DRAFT_1073329 [Mycena sanguinolenta]|nr:hypothetical protein C8R45DRAFT_1073329 [Mycena sanguinolenta]